MIVKKPQRQFAVTILVQPQYRLAEGVLDEQQGRGDDLRKPLVDHAVHDLIWLIRHRNPRIREQSQQYMDSVLCA